MVAGYHTAWYRTRKPEYLRITRFLGKLFLINFAIGVVTGIVQEFQFGMNWSDYSRFVGDIFGAPLAMEGLLAFFLESTFLGLWIFGWDRLPKKLHLASIWATAIGTLLSAFFILAANSWMQHPVGFTIDVAKHRAELTSIWAVLGNSTLWVTFPHVIFGAFVTAGVFVLAISAWQLARKRETATVSPAGEGGSRPDAGGIDRHRGLRRHPGQDHDHPAADEDGGRRGALQLQQAGLVLAVHDRKPQRQQGSLLDPRPAAAVLPGHRLVQREGRRHQPGAGSGGCQVRRR